MTNKEAIEILRANYPDACFGQLREAVDAAIEALKAQNVAGDTISRQAAIDALGEEPPVWYDGEDEKAERNQWRRDVAAIKALPSAQPDHIGEVTEMVGDAVSRQGVLRLLNAVPSEEFATKAMLISGVNALPSAQSERKKGQWMKEDRGHVEYCAVCDQCGFDWIWSDREYFKFCPNCGADMRGEQNERFNQQAGGD